MTVFLFRGAYDFALYNWCSRVSQRRGSGCAFFIHRPGQMGPYYLQTWILHFWGSFTHWFFDSLLFCCCSCLFLNCLLFGCWTLCIHSQILSLPSCGQFLCLYAPLSMKALSFNHSNQWMGLFYLKFLKAPMF